MMWAEFRIAVAIAGAAQRLWDARNDQYDDAMRGMSPIVRDIVIRADLANANVIVLGGRHVVADLTSRAGYVMYPGDVLRLDTGDLREIWIDVVTANDAAIVSYRF